MVSSEDADVSITNGKGHPHRAYTCMPSAGEPLQQTESFLERQEPLVRQTFYSLNLIWTITGRSSSTNCHKVLDDLVRPLGAAFTRLVTRFAPFEPTNAHVGDRVSPTLVQSNILTLIPASIMWLR